MACAARAFGIETEPISMPKSKPSNEELTDLQKMLEAELSGHAGDDEKQPAEPKAATPSSDQLGSLLGELLTEAQREVDRERKVQTDTLEDRDRAIRDAAAQDESATRDELQAQLREETRRRNEVLNRGEQREAQKTVPDLAAVAAQARAPASPRKSRLPMIAAAALVVVGAGVAFAMQPSEEMTLPDIEERVGDTVSKAGLTWQAEEAKRQAEAANKAAAEATQLAEAAQAKAKEEAKARIEAQARANKAEEAAKAAQDGAEDTAAAPAAAKKRRKGKSARGKKKGAKRKRGNGKKLRIRTNVY
jgi:hypothetical protein